MTYRSVGAGPGPVSRFKVDAPFPWGDNTEIALPVQSMVDAAWSAALPKIDALESKLIEDMEIEAGLMAPKLAHQIFDEVVNPEIEKQLTVAFAKADMLKEDALRGALGIAGIIVLSVGLAAWWVKKG